LTHYPNLQIGTYEVSVSSAGFKTWTHPQIALSAGDNVRVDVALDIGAIGDRVEITAAAPALKTESTEVSSTMEQKLVNDLPLTIASGTRTVFNLAPMVPQAVSTNGETGGDDMRIGGGQHNNWNVSVDGITVEMGWRNAQNYLKHNTPSIDAIQEFRIETAALKPKTAA